MAPTPAFLPITDLSRRIAAGELDPRDLVHLFLARAQDVGRALNCWITLCPERAIYDAGQAAERAARATLLGPLDGIPIGVKDNIDVAGVPTTNGLGGEHHPVPGTDAEVIRRLRAAGAIVLGKLNMEECALGAVNDNPHHGRAINPFRADYTPGGSSGGSGAAVAAGLCAAALGTDTGGSVRIPAAYCGVVGLKPSYGLVSVRGVVPLSTRLDHVGVLTRTVADAALMLNIMADIDADPPAYRRQQYEAPAAETLAGLRLGVLSNFEDVETEPAIRVHFAAALDVLRGLGAEICRAEVAGCDVREVRRALFARMEIEAAAHYGELYSAEPQRFSPRLRSYLDWGLKATATRLVKLDRLIACTAHEVHRCLQSIDAIVAPTTPQAAFAFGGEIPETQGDFCGLANLAGCAAVSVPMGANSLGLPLGLQIIAPAGGDNRALAVASAYERAAAWRLPLPRDGPAPAN